MSKKLTPWFPGDVKPVRVGVYETKEKSDTYPVFQRWNGRYWCLVDSTIEKAARWDDRSIFQSDQWRGLTKEAK